MTINEARKKAGITQKQLATTAGVNIRLIQKLEGKETKIKNTTAKNLIAIADALKIDPHILLEE